MRPYPRTEPSKTAQQWAFEGKQTPELTPGGVNRPPRSRPRPALRGGVHGPRESFDPRPLSCYNFDRAFWVCQGALGWGAVSARESPQGAVWDGRGVTPEGRTCWQHGAFLRQTAGETGRAAPCRGAAQGMAGSSVRVTRVPVPAWDCSSADLGAQSAHPPALPGELWRSESRHIHSSTATKQWCLFGTRVTGNVWCSAAAWTASPVPSLAGMLAVTVFHYLGSALSGKKPNCHTIRRSTLS